MTFRYHFFIFCAITEDIPNEMMNGREIADLNTFITLSFISKPLRFLYYLFFVIPQSTA